MRCQRHNFGRLVLSYWANRRRGRSPQKFLGRGRRKGVFPTVTCVKTGAFSPFTTCKFCWQGIAVAGANEGPAEES